MNIKRIVDCLMEQGYRIATAESCTGGMVASSIVSEPNASKVMDACVITYSNRAKMRYARVAQKTLLTYGAVSEKVAAEMATGIARETGANIGIATTGIAGPTGGTPEKPVGLVCFAISVNDEIFQYRKTINSMERNEVRRTATEYILERLSDILIA